MAGNAASLFFDLFVRDHGAAKALDDLGSKAETSGGKLGKANSAIAGMATPAAAGLAALGGIAIGFGQMAATAEQNVGAVETVFGSAAAKVEEFASRSATSVGMSASQYNELAAVTGTALKAAGVPVDELAAKNDALITRGADLASVFGGTTVEAVQSMGSAFRGEFDPLERYGVTLTMNQVNAELAARGQDKLGGAALESAKKQAIMDLIMQQSAASAGNFAKEADTTSGAQARATASFADASSKLGEALLPALTTAAEVLSNVAKWVSENSQLVLTLTAVLGSLAAGILVANAAMTIVNITMAANPIGLVILAVAALIAIIVALVMNWDNVVSFLRTTWDSFSKWWGDGMNKMGGQWNSFWGDVGRNAQNVWNNTLGPVFNFIQDTIQNKVPNAFRDGIKWVGEHWEKLRGIVKAPISFLINTVINDGLIGAFNTVAGWLKLPTLGRVSIPGFESGGYTGEGDRDQVAGVVHAGEFVFTKEQTKKAGVQNLYQLAASLAGYAQGGFVHPVPNSTVSQGYHAGHNGMDFAAALGTPVRAAFGGNVSFARWSTMGGGNEIHLRHPGGWETWYAHLQGFRTKEGMTVNRGQQIGLVGSTGNSTGPHLHYMVLRGGWPNHVNPAGYLDPGKDIPEGGSAWNPVADIINGLMGGFKQAFGGAELIGKLAIGVGGKLLGDVAGMVTKAFGIGSTGQVFDDGGWMDSIGVNKSGRPEAVLNPTQSMDFHRMVTEGLKLDLDGYELQLNADATMGTFRKIARGAADEAIYDANDDLFRGRAR